MKPDAATAPSGGGASITYSLSMSGNAIILTGSNNTTSRVTLPVYDGTIIDPDSGGGTSGIPLNTELIRIADATNGYHINGATGELEENVAATCSDYIEIDPSMTFNFIGYRW